MFGLHFTLQMHRTASFPFPTHPHIEAHVQYALVLFSVRYDLVLFSCTIQSGAALCTISISEPHLLQYSVLGEL